MVEILTYEQVVRWGQDALGRALTRTNQEQRRIEGEVREGIVRADRYDLTEAVEFLLETYGQSGYNVTREDLDATRPRSRLEDVLSRIERNYSDLVSVSARNDRLEGIYLGQRRRLAKKIVDECIKGPIKCIPKTRSKQDLRNLGDVAIEGVGTYQYDLWGYVLDRGENYKECSDQYIDFTDDKKRPVFTIAFWSEWFRLHYGITLHKTNKNIEGTTGQTYDYLDPTYHNFFDQFEPEKQRFRLIIAHNTLGGDMISPTISKSNTAISNNIVGFVDEVLSNSIIEHPNSVAREQAETILTGIVHIPDMLIELQKRKREKQEQQRFELQSRIESLGRF